MPVVNTNISAHLAINAMRNNELIQNKAMGSLATAKRINSSSDDAVGLKFTQNALMNVNELQGLSRNIMDAISMIETIDGYAASIGESLQRMRELAVQSATGTYTDSDRQAMDLEFGQLWNEIQNSYVARNGMVNTRWPDSIQQVWLQKAIAIEQMHCGYLILIKE